MTKRKIFQALIAVIFVLGTFGFATPQQVAIAKAQPQLQELAASDPGQTVRVIAQKMAGAQDTEELVARLGGRVVTDLSIINAFAAEMTAKSALDLAQSDGVRWVSLDAPMQSTAIGDPTVRDEFSTVSYSNNNGTQNWISNWTETGDGSPSPSSGYVRVSSGALYLKSTDRAVSRKVDLAGAPAAMLSFQYKRSSLDTASDYVALQISANDGSTWTELARYQGPGSDWSWQTASFDIAGYASANTIVRFATSSSMDWSDTLYLDNVQIEYTLPLPSSPAGESDETGSTPAICSQCIDTTQLASAYIRAIRADQIWNNSPYLQGQGIGVAVIDSGINPNGDLYTNSGMNRQLADVRFNTDYNQNTSDGYGHGTVISSIVGGDGSDSNGKYIGVAPVVNIINVKVSNDDGSATAANVIQGLQWVLDNKDQYNIRVVNLSLNSTLAESYHTSPLNAAVEILWFNKIVVVASAGNYGGGAIYPPANDPFIITVGATDDKGSSSLSDDLMATFSAYGTTSDGFTKPDLVAPGKNIVGRLVNTNMGMGQAHPSNVISNTYFKMSGTSVSAPMVSGAVALLLQDEPGLNPDQVKYRLMATANKNWAGYNAAKAGAGYLDIYAAINSTTTASSNTGIAVSNLLNTGPDGVLKPTVNWNSVNWNSVNWNSVNWNSVNWNSVNWNSVNWNSDYWDP